MFKDEQFLQQAFSCIPLGYYQDQAENHQFSFIDPNLNAKLSHCLQKIDSVKAQKYMNKYIKMTLKLNLNPSMEVD